MAQVSIPDLSGEQVQKLLSLMDTSKAGYEKPLGKTRWILDSGASCHMKGDIAMVKKKGERI